ncbi:hypothetical protein [Flagellimonas sediminis]|uniref:Uncharacterized protein n=1 Tax=Flagellimonas sediminis TaxID=2696468 RepID=A0A6I5KXB1_9FLAO|nr:hypothetical protein [Allomuricauda sediminis]NDV43002.1 hypothetical protein [Allomuricauda sediminis]
MRLTQSPIVFIFSLALLSSSCVRKGHIQEFANGTEINISLDSLFTKLESLSSMPNPNSEVLVEINEKIRRTIEHIGSQKLLAEIDAGYKTKKHHFSFILSDDKKIAVFSWPTRLENSGNRIKNIALYHSNDKMVPTSLYGTPIIYNGIHQLKMYDGTTLYLLQGQDSMQQKMLNRVNAYLLKNGYLEETPAFPNNETSIVTNGYSISSKMGPPCSIKIGIKGLKIQLQNVLDSSLAQNSLTFDGKKYVFDKELN